jgi:hypothetical protein
VLRENPERRRDGLCGTNGDTQRHLGFAASATHQRRPNMPVDVSDDMAAMTASAANAAKPMTATISASTAELAAASGVDAVAVVAKVNFDMALKRAAGNHFSFDTLSFNGIELSRDSEWIKQLAEALKDNTTCTALDLTNSALTDTAMQQLAIGLAVPSRCPKLKKLLLGENPQLGNMGQTIAQGLARMRPGLEVSFGPGVEPVEGFACQKELIEGRTAWWNGDLAVEGQHNCFYCPDDVLIHAGVPTKPRLELTKGFQGPNGVKYRCEHATFELYNCTGNLVLLTLTKNEGVEV